MRISDWSSDVCSSDLALRARDRALLTGLRVAQREHHALALGEPVVEPLLEAQLIGVGAGGLALLHLDRLVGAAQADRKRVVSGKRWSVRVDLVGRRIITTKQRSQTHSTHTTLT